MGEIKNGYQPTGCEKVGKPPIGGSCMQDDSYNFNEERIKNEAKGTGKTESPKYYNRGGKLRTEDGFISSIDLDHLDKLIKYNDLLGHYQRYKIGFKEDSTMDCLIGALKRAISWEDWDHCEELCTKLYKQYDHIIKMAQLEQKTKYEQISEDCKKIPFEKVKEMLLTNPKPDMVNHPSHYNVNGFEVIDIIKAFTDGLEGIQAVDTANAIKYILRWHHKNGVEDLKKAKWYIEHLIKEIEDEN